MSDAPSWDDWQLQYEGNFLYKLDKQEKLIALTFDDGPSPVSEQVLDLLEEKDVLATFFWQGNNLRGHPSTIARAMADGHAIANHSWDHPHGDQLSPTALLRRQILPTQKVFNQLTGWEPNLYRPPFGAITEEQLSRLSECGLVVVGWSITSLDWDYSQNSADEIEKRVLGALHPGAIILFHDVYHGDSASGLLGALEVIIDEARQQGYQFVPIDGIDQRDKPAIPDNCE